MRNALVVVGLIAVIGGVWLVVQSRSKQTGISMQPTTTSIPVDVPIETATLDPQDGSDSQGIATRQFIDRIFVHGLSALLPDPPQGQVYVGWLAQRDVATSAVRTGVLVKQTDGYALDYSSPVDYSGYDEVLVTLQPTQQTKPETIILKGSFPVQQVQP